MKLRETLIARGRTRVTVPKGLYLYPKNKLWAFLISIALLSGFIGFIMLVVGYEKTGKEAVTGILNP